MQKYLVFIVALLVYVSGLIIDFHTVYSYFQTTSTFITFLAGILLCLGCIYLVLKNSNTKNKSETKLINRLIYFTSIYPFIVITPTFLKVVLKIQVSEIFLMFFLPTTFFIAVQILALKLLFILLRRRV